MQNQLCALSTSVGFKQQETAGRAMLHASKRRGAVHLFLLFGSESCCEQAASYYLSRLYARNLGRLRRDSADAVLMAYSFGAVVNGYILTVNNT